MEKVIKNIIDQKTCQDSTFRIGPRMPIASPGEEASSGMTFTAGSASSGTSTLLRLVVLLVLLVLVLVLIVLVHY